MVLFWRENHDNKKRNLISSFGSPGNPAFAGELTTHGLIPHPRDCFNQHLFQDFINQIIEIIPVVFICYQLLDKWSCFLLFNEFFNSHCITARIRNFKGKNQFPRYSLCRKPGKNFRMVMFVESFLNVISMTDIESVSWFTVEDVNKIHAARKKEPFAPFDSPDCWKLQLDERHPCEMPANNFY